MNADFADADGACAQEVLAAGAVAGESVQAAGAVAAAQMLFRRTLATWTCDVLALQRSGTDQVIWSRRSTRTSPAYRTAA